MNDTFVISGSVTFGTPPTNADCGWKDLIERYVSFRAIVDDIIDDAAAEDALRYSFIPVTPPLPQGPMPCQRLIDLP